MSEIRYKAFISYSHDDERWARWLHRSIEGYRIPARVVSAYDLQSNRIRPVFRDRAELGAANSLSANIEEALRVSASLVVICSPAAYASRWVNEEIRAFRRVNSSGRIYAILVATTPTSAFPPAIFDEEPQTEPIAADVHADGRRGALLKIISGILDVPFAELQHRESQARNRRLATIASGSIAAAAVFATLTVYLFIAERQATIANQESEAVQAFLVNMLAAVSPLEQGSDVTVLEMLDQGRDNIDRSFADEPMVAARIRTTMGQVYRELGSYDASRTLLKKSLETRISMLGDGDPVVASTQRELARTLQRLNEFDAARVLYNKALATQDTVAHDQALELANTLVAMGGLHDELGEFKEALVLYERALSIVQNVHGRSHPSIAIVLNNMSYVHRKMADYDSAFELSQEALDIQLRTLPPDDLLISDSLNSLGTIEDERENHDEAQQYLARALKIREQRLGPRHGHVAEMLNNLAINARKRGEVPAAERYYNQALDIHLEVFGPDHVTVAMSQHNLANLLRDEGTLAQAELLYQQADRTFTKNFGPEHWTVAENMVQFSQLMRVAGDEEAANDLLASARAIREKSTK